MRTPRFILKFDGLDVTQTWGKRLISAKAKDAAGWEKDSLILTFNNANSSLDLPFPETKIEFSLGYTDGEMRDFGTFYADSIKHTLPNNTVTLTAKAAQIGAGSADDKMERMKERQSREWRAGTPIRTVLEQVAQECGLAVQIGESIAADIPLPPECEVQNAETIFDFLLRSARILGFSVKIYSGTLFAFMPKDANAIAGAPIEIKDWEISSASFNVKRITAFKSVAAKWHDLATAQLYTETAGTGTPVFEIAQEFSTKEAAKSAAEAELAQRLKQAKTCTFSGAAKMAVCAEGFITLTGEKLNALSAGKWRVTSVDFDLNKSGLTMSGSGEFTA